MALDRRGLMLLTREPMERKHVQNTDHVPRTVPGLGLKILIEIFMHSFIYSSKLLQVTFEPSCVCQSQRGSDNIGKKGKVKCINVEKLYTL